MLPKRERVSREVFSTAFSNGKRSHTPLFTCVYTKNDTLGVSVVVSKKVLPTAVGRNKLRRQIYAIVRGYRTKKPMTGIHIFIMKKDAAHASYATLTQSIEAHLQTLHSPTAL